MPTTKDRQSADRVAIWNPKNYFINVFLSIILKIRPLKVKMSPTRAIKDWFIIVHELFENEVFTFKS